MIGGSLQAQKKDKKAIAAVIQSAYVEGLFNQGDTSLINAGFHPTFRLPGQKEGEEMRELFIGEWKEIVATRKEKGAYPPPAEKEVSIEIQRIDVVESVASVKLDFLVGGKKAYVDFIDLYKFETGWKLVNKVYFTVNNEQ